MMAKQKLSAQVSISEMLHLRNDGLSNKAIAQNLGVSYQTVLKYIGKEDKRGSRRAVSPTLRRDPVNMVTIVPNVLPSVSLPIITRHVISTMQGCSCVYKVDSERDYIELCDTNGCTVTGYLSYDEINTFINELNYILSNIPNRDLIK